MISLRQPVAGLQPMPVQPEMFGRRITLTYAATLLAMVLAAAAGYLLAGYSADVARSSAAAAALTQEQLMLSQRVASLSAQLALGNAGVKPDLRAAAERFAHIETRLVAGDSIAGYGPVHKDAALKALYFGGGAPLDALSTEFANRALRIASLSPDDPALGAQTAPLFILAGRELPDKLGAALRVRAENSAGRLDLVHTAQVIVAAMVLVLALVTGLALFRPLARRVVELMREANQLVQDATLDPATGMLNRRSFHARGAIEVQKARRYGRPLSVLLIDADQLPTIEDEFGPDGGLSMLRALTTSVFAGTRVCDLVARVDDDQFAILLPETNRDGAVILAERLRQRISEVTVPIDDTLVSCTVSIGVAAAEKDASFLWPTFKRADEALYEAKMRGRNQVYAAAA